ncbi:Hsp20/alpha crystallin family protein [Foetidibacter luteolus]|uniref:Hsp20/alpha crystallin family protein n=1 Tax=Foetidibacter luteolus TaxID=2608880 RepID=UPI00129B2D9B|nr:Hsp20/alpha crystallin family protein [Foetidibacter luteolus]
MANIMKKTNAQPATFGSVVDEIFQNNLARFFEDDFWGAGRLNVSQRVPVNVRETETAYEMELIAPGLNKQDFHLQVTGDSLTIFFEHKEEQQQKEADDGWLKREYRQQSFSRSFSLDDSVDAEKLTARYDNGILYISLPKNEKSRKISRNITVN